MNTLSKLNKLLSEKELQRLEGKITYEVSGCWLLSVPLDRDGYGQVMFRRKNRRFHRVIWYAVNGVIGSGMVIDHKCRTRHCVNPEHLHIVTHKQNTLENSRSIQAYNAKKTHCKMGHLYDRRYPVKKGSDRYQRYCSVCQAEKTKRLRKKWAETPLLEGV